MNSSLLFSLLLVGCIWGAKCECEPYYPRMFWNPDSEQIKYDRIDLIFMFNTNTSCPYSYLHIFYNSTIHKFRCVEKKLETFANNQSEFVAFVHKCSVYIQELQEISSFQYQLFGSKIIQLEASPSEIYLVQTPTLNRDLRFAVISDWGPLVNVTYKPLNDTLDYILAKRVEERAAGAAEDWRIVGLILNGDYAYNLETDKCYMYLRFLNEVSRVSRFWPIITNVGNHESKLPKSMYLFENSFIIGQLSTLRSYERVQAYRFVNKTTFVYFDPFLEIYKTGTPEQYEVMKSRIKQLLEKRRDLFPEEFMIMACHYPVMCSQVDPHCRDAMSNMPDLYEYLSTQFDGKGLVDLYIGSHMHQYERIWPFVNNQFVNESSPYYRGRLANFVQAVAGVNYFIIQKYYPPEYFSQFSTYNLTGMGIMNISGNSLENNLQIHYQHIVTPETYTVIDEWIVTNKYKPDQFSKNVESSPSKDNILHLATEQ